MNHGDVTMSVHYPLPTISNLRLEMLGCLRSAYQYAGSPRASRAIRHCAVVLDALALPTSEYVLYRNRLRNARQYSQLAERGAARFELSQLLRSFCDPE